MLGNRVFPEAWSRLCVCQASFLMTFAMGGVPHAGARHLVPSSYRVLRGSIYSFPLARHSCPLSAEICRCSACTSVSEGVFLMYPWFGMHVCVWRCIPDVSMERDVVHVHLLLCHHLLSQYCFNFYYQKKVRCLQNTLFFDLRQITQL